VTIVRAVGVDGRQGRVNIEPVGVNIPSTVRRWTARRRRLAAVTPITDEPTELGRSRRSTASIPRDQVDPTIVNRVVVAIAGAPDSERLIRGAARLARSTDAALVGVHVRPPGRAVDAPTTHEHRRLLQELGGTYEEIEDESVAEALRDFAADGHTQLVLGATRRPRWREVTSRSVLEQVARDADFDVHVITPLIDRSNRSAAHRRTARLPAGRRRGAWALAVVGVPLLTAVLLPARSEGNFSASLLLFVLLNVAVAAIGGAAPALFVAITGFVAVNWFLTPPFHTLVVATRANLTALFTFLVVGTVVSFLVAQVSRRSIEAARARSDAETLARAAREIAALPDPAARLLERILRTFGLTGASVLRADGAGWVVMAVAGSHAPTAPTEATSTIALNDGSILAVTGPDVDASKRVVLDAMADQVATAMEQRRLQDEASRAAALAETDRLRTALLRAVSHDLRTPLASIKASVSSLLQRDVDWPPDAVHEFLETIDEETDRLNRVIGNLLDMGRLQANAVHVDNRAVSIDEVVLAALTSMSTDTSRVELQIDEPSPVVRADPVLLERALANLISNALAWSPTDTPVTIDAEPDQERVALRIIDHGPGVPPDQRERLFEPFQRLGDRSNDTGAGLGLAVARGFVETTGGEIRMADTPGGGLTIIVILDRANPG
jgi:two-component system sensor histidine kinase KdpD